MRHNFILEILSEEIPALMQKNAAENLIKIANEILAKNGLLFSVNHLKAYVTPFRLVLEILDLAEKQEIAAIRKMGPRIDADEKAINGFLKANNISNVAELEQIENKGQKCFFYVKPASEVRVADILRESVPQILQKMVNYWPKLMRYDVENSENQAKWVRPIRNILALLGGELIKFDFAGLNSCSATFVGNYANIKFNLENSAQYHEALEKNSVILDQEKRKKEIISQVEKIKHDFALELIDDLKSPLFDEVCGLCESPTALIGSIDEKFLELPKEVLILTLKLNQKYFCLKTQSGELSTKFIFVVNVKVDDFNHEKLILDNEKLVRARLSDAEFFIHEDLKEPLISRLQALNKIVFHKKLGSIQDKVNRMQSLAKFMSVFVPHTDLSLIERASELAKIDLTTKAVGELPELQGKIGSFYAAKQRENKKIIAAIYEHYLPLGPSSELPKTSLGIVLSIADKIDSIVGFFLADEKPTSSKDPYALRRAVLGIIRIGFQYNIAFPIRILVEKSLNAYPVKTLKELLGEKEGDGKFLKKKKDLVEEIIIFFVERLKTYLKENEMLQQDIVNAVIEEYLSDLEAHKYCDILYLAKKIKFLSQFISEKENHKIIQLYKRSANILAIEEKKDGKKYVGKISILGLRNKYERLLYKRIKQVKASFKKLIIKGEFEDAFKLLHVLEMPLAQFFDHVIVNDKDKNLRENRLFLLAKIRALFNQVADLSKVEI